MPRYQILADILRDQISDGTYPPGSYLPTEFNLCKLTNMSRHTVREALRILREQGLIARRQGIGTQVLSEPQTMAFEQNLDGIDSLLQYATDAPLNLLNYKAIKATADDARRNGLTIDRTYIRAEGVRTTLKKISPVGLTRIYMREDIALPKDQLIGLAGSIVTEMERQNLVSVQQIDQRIASDLLNNTDAKPLKAKTGTAVLLVRRVYYDQNDRVCVASETIHPSDRFVYRQVVKRAK